MKYIWIIIVAIMALIWSIASIIDIIWVIREEVLWIVDKYKKIVRNKK